MGETKRDLIISNPASSLYGIYFFNQRGDIGLVQYWHPVSSDNECFWHWEIIPENYRKTVVVTPEGVVNETGLWTTSGVYIGMYCTNADEWILVHSHSIVIGDRNTETLTISVIEFRDINITAACLCQTKHILMLVALSDSRVVAINNLMEISDMFKITEKIHSMTFVETSNMIVLGVLSDEDRIMRFLCKSIKSPSEESRIMETVHHPENQYTVAYLYATKVAIAVTHNSDTLIWVCNLQSKKVKKMQVKAENIGE